LVQAAVEDPHGRAMAHVLDRVEGKVADRVLTGPADPFADLDVETLLQLAAGDSEPTERRTSDE